MPKLTPGPRQSATSASTRAIAERARMTGQPPAAAFLGEGGVIGFGIGGEHGQLEPALPFGFPVAAGRVAPVASKDGQNVVLEMERLRGFGELVGLGFDHVRPGEEVVVLEEVGLERQHLLDPERPLLVPRSRQPERLVPRGKLDRPGAGVA